MSTSSEYGPTLLVGVAWAGLLCLYIMLFTIDDPDTRKFAMLLRSAGYAMCIAFCTLTFIDVAHAWRLTLSVFAVMLGDRVIDYVNARMDETERRKRTVMRCPVISITYPTRLVDDMSPLVFTDFFNNAGVQTCFKGRYSMLAMDTPHIRSNGAISELSLNGFVPGAETGTTKYSLLDEMDKLMTSKFGWSYWARRVVELPTDTENTVVVFSNAHFDEERLFIREKGGVNIGVCQRSSEGINNEEVAQWTERMKKDLTIDHVIQYANFVDLDVQMRALLSKIYML